jgi:hypothetical protein
MSRNTHLALALAPFLLVTACADANKAPAEKAIAAGEAAVNGLSDEVRQLAPEAAQDAREALGAAKAAAAKADWKGALKLAGDLPGKVQAAIASADVKRAEAVKRAEESAHLAALQKSWDEATSALPALLGDLKAKVAQLGKGKAKLPKGVTKKTLAAAKTTIKSIEDGLAKAKEQARTDLAGAVPKAAELAAKAHELAGQLMPKAK